MRLLRKCLDDVMAHSVLGVPDSPQAALEDDIREVLFTAQKFSPDISGLNPEPLILIHGQARDKLPQSVHLFSDP